MKVETENFGESEIKCGKQARRPILNWQCGSSRLRVLLLSVLVLVEDGVVVCAHAALGVGHSGHVSLGGSVEVKSAIPRLAI